MNIRSLKAEDIDKLRWIHHSYYRNEFPFPDFLNNFLCAFVVSNDDGTIISAGGVRAIAESVIITNKSCSVRERRAALYQVLDASEYLTKRADFKELVAFVQDDKWYHHLKKVGFHPTKGKPLVLEF